jgi:pyrroline-5-carboxylate reductase
MAGQPVIVGLIGAGNMATALADGWSMAESGPDELVVSDADEARAKALAERVGATRAGSNVEVAESADVLVLAVKPGALEPVARDVRVAVAERRLPVASILGATSIAALETALGPGTPVLRLMPNLAAGARAGTFLYAAGPSLDERTERSLLDLFGLLGELVAVDEHLMDAGTAISGCGPALFALVVESLVDGGVREGLSAEQASELAISTMAGTAELLRRRGGDPVTLRRQVTSPGGITAAAVAALEAHSVRAAFGDAVRSAVVKGRAMQPAAASAEGEGE